MGQLVSVGCKGEKDARTSLLAWVSGVAVPAMDQEWGFGRGGAQAERKPYLFEASAENSGCLV